MLLYLYICALLHFRGFEFALVIKPQNIAAVSGESITLHCASDVSAGNIIWSITDPGSSGNKIIYNNVLDSNASSYISVSDLEDGNCSLHINASLTAANRYICTEGDTAQEASAELIVLESGLQCNSTNGSAHISCFTVSAGNWAPVVECYQWKPDVGLSVLQRNLTSTVDNNVTTRIWNYTTSDGEWFRIFCQTSFEEYGRPNEISATNIPKYFNQTFAIVLHSGTTSNGKSAGCPECSTCTGANTSPVTTAAKCPECPRGATGKCPRGPAACPGSAAKTCPQCRGRCNNAENHVKVIVNYPARGSARKAVAAKKCPVERKELSAAESRAAADERPATAGERPEAVGVRAAAGERPVARERPSGVGERPTAADERPATARERPEAVGVRPAAAAECPVGAYCIASLVLNCMVMIAVIGYAVYKWKSKKTVQDKKPKSTERVVELKISDQGSSQGEKAGDI